MNFTFHMRSKANKQGRGRPLCIDTAELARSDRTVRIAGAVQCVADGLPIELAAVLFSVRSADIEAGMRAETAQLAQPIT